MVCRGQSSPPSQQRQCPIRACSHAGEDPNDTSVHSVTAHIWEREQHQSSWHEQAHLEQHHALPIAIMKCALALWMVCVMESWDAGRRSKYRYARGVVRGYGTGQDSFSWEKRPLDFDLLKHFHISRHCWWVCKWNNHPTIYNSEIAALKFTYYL